jgi:hypothetical protein
MTAAAPFPAFSAPLGASAVVVATDGDHVGVRSPALGAVRALIATDRRPRPGDRVVLVFEPGGDAYVVGIVGDSADAAPTRLALPDGDLELCAERGKITLRARDGVEIDSSSVSVRAEREVVLDSAGGRSRLSLDGDAAELRAGLLEAKAARLRVLAEEVTAVAVRADTHVEALRQKLGSVETEAGRVVERAKSFYQTVEDIAQTRAGRLRLVAEGSLHALADRAQLTARKVFRINGDRIHLG